MMAAAPSCIADTSVIVALLRQDSDVARRIAGRVFAITFVTLAELSVGVLKSRKPDAAWREVQRVPEGREMLHVSTLTPAIYARIFFDLQQRGILIPINDIWIAALAIEAGLPILARDQHFSRVTNLTVIDC